MQQIAASNKDIAAQGLFPGDPAVSEFSGTGAEFARVLESNASGDGEQGYRGHGDFYNSGDFEAVTSQAANEIENSEAAPVFVAEGSEPETTEQAVVAAEGTENADLSDEEELHDEWVSIIQKLNGDEKSHAEAGDEVEESPAQLEANLTVAEEDSNYVTDEELEIEPAKNITTQNTTVPLDSDIDKETVKIDEEVEIESDEEVEDQVASSTAQWKEELKQKFLNSGYQLSVSQVKEVEKDLSAMSDEQLQQLMDNDKAFKQMLSDILKVEEPSPQDLALLMALAQQDDDHYSDLEVGDLIEGQGPTNIDNESSGEEQSAGSDEQVELDEGEQIVSLVDGDTGTEDLVDEAFQEQLYGSLNDNTETSGSGDENEITLEAPPQTVPVEESSVDDTIAATEVETVDQTNVEPDVNLENLNIEAIAEEDDSEQVVDIDELNEEIIPEVAISETNIEPTENQTENDKPAPVSASTVTIEPKTNDEQRNLEQLIHQLDSAVKTDEQKITALENLTRRIESSEVAQTPAGKTFIDSMKQAASDLKEQLKSGGESNVNLNKLVTEAVDVQSGKADAVALDGQVKGALQQMVSVAQSHLSLEPSARENLVNSFQASMNNRENAASQIEASKSQQQSVQNQLMDKAINIQKPEAAQELANKVQVMLNQKNMVADIRLDPPDLGQMQIKISMQGDSASVSMVVQSQAAREALEHSQPRLRELLEQQGIELGQSSVQQESQGQKGEGDGSNYASGKTGEALEDVSAETENETIVSVNEPEGIDYFA